MNATRKHSAMQEAHENLNIASKMVREACGGDYRIMEQCVNKSQTGECSWAIIVERWLIGRGQQLPVEVILYVTDSWWNVYWPVTTENSLKVTAEVLQALFK